MDYNTYVATIQNLMAVATNPVDPNFTQILPSIITSAEQRIYRDLDLISTVVTDATTSAQIGIPIINIPGAFVVVQNMNAIDSSGFKTPITPTGRALIDTSYSDQTMTGRPTYFAMITQNSMALGPIPDAPYSIEVIGTQRPATLSATNTTTFISVNLPDLFINASMIFASGYMRNFGAQADNPQMATSWESEYQLLFKAANVEEMRKRFHSQAWSSEMPTPAAPVQG